MMAGREFCMSEIYGTRMLAVIATVGLTSVGLMQPVQAQQLWVLDAACRANLIAACIQEQTLKPGEQACANGSIKRMMPSAIFPSVPPALQCVPPEEVSLGKSYGEQCAIRVDTHLARDCVKPIDLQAIASGNAVVKELAETNAILRSDMRTLLNQFCKSYSPKPETCDATIPAPN